MAKNKLFDAFSDKLLGSITNAFMMFLLPGLTSVGTYFLSIAASNKIKENFVPILTVMAGAPPARH